MNMKKELLKKIINGSDNIVFLGGAGVSTASGIPDFRSASGLYAGAYSPETILSHSFFISSTKEFYDFYKTKMIYIDAKPNNAHKALARLEAEGKLRAVITQNIDELHQKAGSKNVLELHGSVYKNTCMKCFKRFGISSVMDAPGIPFCDGCGGIIKPDVVLYEEGLDSAVINASVKYISEADVLIVGGTSLNVYPAAGLVDYYRGNKLVLINKSETTHDAEASLVLRCDIGVLNEMV